MKKVMLVVVTLFLMSSSFTACKKEVKQTDQPQGQSGIVTGKVTDSRGNAIAGVKVVIEHTVLYASYVYATTDNNGNYKAVVPAEPAGSWTAKAQVEKTAYGKHYTFDLVPENTDPITKEHGAVRNFTWKLTGQRAGTNGFYGAHVDLYQFGTDVPMDKVKLVFTPFGGESTLIDGSHAVPLERNVEDVAGTFMAKDVPVGKYTVKAVYESKKLLLDNRHDEGEPEEEKTVIFGKNGHLAETEYNIEFWLSE